MSELVTIGIPTVSRLGYLKLAVESALSQTYPRIEVVVCQNPAESGLDEGVAAWARAEPRIRHHTNERRLSLGASFNATAAHATGTYLVLLGDDDRLLPTFVAELVGAIEGANANVAFSDHWFIDGQGVRLASTTESLAREFGRDRLSAGLQQDPAACVWGNSVSMSASLMRTADVVRLRFPEDTNAIDIAFFARLAAEGGRFAFLPERLGEYRIHGGQETVAGLQYEALIDHLRVIPVPAAVEPIKRRFLERAVYSATKCRLLIGDRAKARELVAHEYYPRVSLRSAAQRLLVTLPAPVGSALMRGFLRFRRALR